MDETYNGWRNYATWRVNLEIIDGIDLSEQGGFESITDLCIYLRDYVSDVVNGFEMEKNDLKTSYAMAFIGDVDYAEIARALMADKPSLINEVA